jgi:hypothetical protein
MRCLGPVCRLVLIGALAAIVLGLPSKADAQDGSGVVVDADGVLRTKVYTDPGGQLMRQRLAAARASLDADLAERSPRRHVSLTRLEGAIAKHGNAPTDAMRYLAGLQRVEYVFFYPDSNDIVIAGPAEGWVSDLAGRVVGITTGRPVVQLQDLVVALRAFSPDGRRTPFIGCSIDPTQEGLQAMQNFLRQIGSYAHPSDVQRTRYIANGLKTSLGLQKVSVNGVKPNTHFAQVLVEADYRMKLIGIGLERPPVKIVSYVERANPAAVSRNALQRWYFVPDYQCVRVSKDRLAMQLVGDGVKLVGEGEQVTAGGGREATGKLDRASQAFVTGFTEKYPELAARAPVYAELRNLIDLSVAAAFIQQEDYYGRAGWNMPLLGDERKFAVETYNTPKQVESAVNALWKGRRLMTPIGGGVTIQPTQAITSANLLRDEAGEVAQTREEVRVTLPEGRWWWD